MLQNVCFVGKLLFGLYCPSTSACLAVPAIHVCTVLSLFMQAFSGLHAGGITTCMLEVSLHACWRYDRRHRSRAAKAIGLAVVPKSLWIAQTCLAKSCRNYVSRTLPIMTARFDVTDGNGSALTHSSHRPAMAPMFIQRAG